MGEGKGAKRRSVSGGALIRPLLATNRCKTQVKYLPLKADPLSVYRGDTTHLKVAGIYLTPWPLSVYREGEPGGKLYDRRFSGFGMKGTAICVRVSQSTDG